MRSGLWLFVLALAARAAVVVLSGFDGLYGQDAFAYYDQAVAMAARLPRGEPPPTDFFWPNGYPAMAALSMAVFGPKPFAAQVVSLLCGAALAPLAYVICRDLFPHAHPRAGIIAGTIAAVAGQSMLSSVVVMADVAALFWAALAMWLTVNAWRGPRAHAWFAAAGGALGMAMITRWVYGLLLPVLLLHALRQCPRDRRWLRRLLVAVAAMAVVVLPQVGLSMHRPEGVFHSWLLGWRPGNALGTHFETVDGIFAYRLPVGLFYALPAAHPGYLVPPLGILVLWGGVCAWRARSRDSLVLLVGWAGAMYAFLAGIPYENLRFGLSLWLPLVVLAGVGADALWTRPRLSTWTRAAVALSVAGMMGWSCWTLARFVRRQHAIKGVVREVEQRLPPGATLVTFGLTLTARRYTGLDVVEIFEQDAASLAVLARRPGRLYLLLDTANAATQWRGRPPDENYRWLREHTRLERMAEFPPYTLFESVRADAPSPASTSAAPPSRTAPGSGPSWRNPTAPSLRRIRTSSPSPFRMTRGRPPVGRPVSLGRCPTVSSRTRNPALRASPSHSALNAAPSHRSAGARASNTSRRTSLKAQLTSRAVYPSRRLTSRDHSQPETIRRQGSLRRVR